MTLLILLTACAPPPAHYAPTLSLTQDSIPESGIYSPEDVLIAPRGGDVFELAAGAWPDTPERELLTVVWCRARLLSHENGYDGWFPLRYTRSLSERGEMGNGIVQMVRGEMPEGKKNVDELRDWCREVPERARKQPEQSIEEHDPFIPFP